MGNTAQQCRLGLFQDSDSAGNVEDSKSTSGVFRSHTFVPVIWMCKRQTSVSHCSTEAEIISLGIGLRMDGIPALDLWDLVKEVFRSSPNQLNNTQGQVQGNLSRDTTSNKHTRNKTKVLPTQHDIFDLNNVDCVPSNARLSRFGAMLYIFQKKKKRGRDVNYHQRQKSNNGTCIQNAQSCPWNNLLNLYNISHFSSLCIAQNVSLNSGTKTMAKRRQKQEGDNRIVAKSKPMNLAFSVSTSSSSTMNNPIASKSLEILKAPCRTDWSNTGKLDARDRNHDAVSCSQGWQKDAFADANTGTPVVTEEDQEHLNYLEDSVSTGKLVAPGYPGNSGNSGTDGNDKDWPHILNVSTNYVLHMENVFSMLRQRYGRSPTDRMKDLDVNTAFWSYLCLSLIKLQFILIFFRQKASFSQMLRTGF